MRSDIYRVDVRCLKFKRCLRDIYKKKNAKRSSDEDESKSRKRAKESTSIPLPNDRSKDVDRAKFKISLKLNQERSTKPPEHRERPTTSTLGKDRPSDRDGDWSRHDDRQRLNFEAPTFAMELFQATFQSPAHVHLTSVSPLRRTVQMAEGDADLQEPLIPFPELLD